MSDYHWQGYLLKVPTFMSPADFGSSALQHWTFGAAGMVMP
jgi:hypothetical protein